MMSTRRRLASHRGAERGHARAARLQQPRRTAVPAASPRLPGSSRRRVRRPGLLEAALAEAARVTRALRARTRLTTMRSRSLARGGLLLNGTIGCLRDRRGSVVTPDTARPATRPRARCAMRWAQLRGRLVRVRPPRSGVFGSSELPDGVADLQRWMTRALARRTRRAPRRASARRRRADETRIEIGPGGDRLRTARRRRRTSCSSTRPVWLLEFLRVAGRLRVRGGGGHAHSQKLEKRGARRRRRGGPGGRCSRRTGTPRTARSRASSTGPPARRTAKPWRVASEWPGSLFCVRRLPSGRRRRGSRDRGDRDARSRWSRLRALAEETPTPTRMRETRIRAWIPADTGGCVELRRGFRV